MLRKRAHLVWGSIFLFLILGLFFLRWKQERHRTIACLGEVVAADVTVTSSWRSDRDFVCLIEEDAEGTFRRLAHDLNLRSSGGSWCQLGTSIVERVTGRRLGAVKCVNGLHPEGGVIVLLQDGSVLFAVRSYL